MTNEEFNQRVFEHEAMARDNPKAYRFRLMLVAMLGNLYLGMILTLVAATLGGLLISVKLLGALGFKLILVVSVFLYMMLKALWVKIPPPTGSEIRASQAPQLFAMIEELCGRLGAPHFHTVLVTDDFNAGVVQAPRLGIFGWHRNYLLIGLPLMKSLSVEQFKAVLAHEFGHLAKGHGRMSSWIYRQRMRWARLLAILEANHSKGSFLFGHFLKWYAPYFNAYSFPLARANEYEADAASARLTSARTAAEALTTVDVVSRYLGERYWPQIYRQADELPQPGFTPYAHMGLHFAAELEEEACKTWLDRALAQETTSGDTHPALSDRLQAIGETPHLAPPAPGASADQLLGLALPTLTELFDRRWRESILPVWEGRHREVQEGRRRLGELDAQFEAGVELSLADAFDRAKLTRALGDNGNAALDQLSALRERAPDNPIILFSLGTSLLARDDDSGIAFIQQAMELDEYAAAPIACEALRDYAWRRGREEEAKGWHQRFVEVSLLKQEADRERNQVLLKDTFGPHGMDEEVIAQLQVHLKTIPDLRKVYLVRKHVKTFPHRPCFVLGYTVGGFLEWPTPQRAAAVLRRIQQLTIFPSETLIINVEGDNARFGRKFRRMKGARIV